MNMNYRTVESMNSGRGAGVLRRIISSNPGVVLTVD